MLSMSNMPGHEEEPRTLSLHLRRRSLNNITLRGAMRMAIVDTLCLSVTMTFTFITSFQPTWSLPQLPVFQLPLHETEHTLSLTPASSYAN